MLKDAPSLHTFSLNLLNSVGFRGVICCLEGCAVPIFSLNHSWNYVTTGTCFEGCAFSTYTFSVIVSSCASMA